VSGIAIDIDMPTLLALRDLAHGRNAGKRPSSSRRKSRSFSDLDLDFSGLKGEYVVSRVYGVPFDTKSYGAKGDSGVDVWTPMPGGVKTNHRAGGYLLVSSWAEISKVEILHLVDGPCAPPTTCVCHEPTALETWRYAGWISVDDFRRLSRRADWGMGPRRYVPQSYLKEREELVP
jgi:hypothetical protein